MKETYEARCAEQEIGEESEPMNNKPEEQNAQQDLSDLAQRKIEAAIKFAARGWRILPLNPCTKRSKLAWEEATYKEETLKSWWSQSPQDGIGVLSDSTGMWILDEDGEEGQNEISRLESEHGPLPETVTVLTRRGRHRYFLNPDGRQIRNKARFKPGLDRIGRGSCFILPPSQHPFGMEYRFAEGKSFDDIPVAAAPGWLVDLVSADEKQSRESGATPSPANVHELKDFLLNKYLEVASNGNRNHNGTQLAMQLRDNRFSYDDAVDLMERYQEKVSGGDHPYTRDEALATLRSIYSTPPREPFPFSFNKIIPLNDAGNAYRLSLLAGQDILYVSAWKSWMRWDEARWVRDEGSFSRREMLQATKKITDEIPAAIQVETKGLSEKDKASKEGEIRRRYHKFKSDSQNNVRIRNAVDLLKNYRLAEPEDFDSQPFLLNVQTGTVDLAPEASKRHFSHRREDRITKMSDVWFEPGSEFASSCPNWLTFLDEVFLGDAELIRFVQKAIGYTLTGDARERVVFICHGGGRNGKTTLIGIMQDLLGDLAVVCPKETFLARSQRGIPNDLARLKGCRLAVASEMDEGDHLAESVIKQMAGGPGESITARYLHGEFFDFPVTWKVWLATNNKPQIRGGDQAIWDRIRLIPFDRRFEDDEVIKDYKERFLKPELPGILTWAIEGCGLWLKEGLEAPQRVLEASQQYRDEEDLLAPFLEMCCRLSRGCEVSKGVLYETYVEWCGLHHEESMSKKMFGQKIKLRPGIKERKASGMRVWAGLEIIDPQDSGLEKLLNDDICFDLPISIGNTPSESAAGIHPRQDHCLGKIIERARIEKNSESPVEKRSAALS